MDITIRTLQAEDMQDDSGLYDTLENLTDVRPISSERGKEIFEKITKQGTTIFVAVGEGQICGCVTLLAEQKIIHQGCVVGHIEDVSTRKGYEGNGIGSKLMRAAIEHAKEHKFYRIILDCNESLFAYYERFGFNKHANEMRLELAKSF